jgi:serine/threonine protein kinase
MTSTLPSRLSREEMSELIIGQCPNPACDRLNLAEAKICDRCGSPLFLKERYRVLRYLGSGGFATTFEAIDEQRLNTACVIKQFAFDREKTDDLDFLKYLFEQEAEILTKVGSHPQIPSLLAFFEQSGCSYIVQELIPGWDLFTELSDRCAFDESKIWQLLDDLLPILQFIHDRQIIHRDIKLGNILRQPDGKLALIDFGSSQKLGSNTILAPHHPIVATPGYAAPEQLDGKVYPASDLYSLGVTIVRLLTGCLPEADNSEPLFDERQQKWLWRQPEINVSNELAEIIDRLVAFDLKDRYQSAAEVWQLVKANLPKIEIVSTNKVNQKDVSGHLADLKFSQDYQKLHDLLAAKQYQQADLQTWNLLLHLSDRVYEGFLSLNSLEKISDRDLLLIDSLWRKFSSDRFGFTVQKNIYQNLGGTKNFNYKIWTNFGEVVGWYTENNWLNYGHLNFTATAPEGHLPACFVDVLNRSGVERGVCGWWRLGFVFLLEKLRE